MVRAFHRPLFKFNVHNNLRFVVEPLLARIQGTAYYVRIGHHSKSKHQAGKIANPACGQLNRKNEMFPPYILKWLEVS